MRNDQRGHRACRVRTGCTLAIVTTWLFAPALPSAQSAPASIVPTFPQQVIELTNRVRIQAGLPPLKENAQLDAAAGAHSRAMATQGFFSHTNPLTKSDPGDRASSAGYVWLFVAENIAEGPATPAAAISAWMHSPVHRANILSPEPREIGVAYVRDPRSAHRCGDKPCTHFWTQVFGRR